jgi:arylsulfatase A-like enzyme
LINVPLLLYYPKTLPAGKRIDTQVRMIDILPTVLDVLDIPLTASIQGQSLLPLIEGSGVFQEDTVFFRNHALRL